MREFQVALMDALPFIILISFIALLVFLYYTGSNAELWLERRGTSTSGVLAPQRWKGFWFRTFMYSEAVLVTLVLVAMIQSSRGRSHLDAFYYPIQTSIIAWTWAGTTLFLLFVSPFFFRRLGYLAIAGWIIAIFSVIWGALPSF